MPKLEQLPPSWSTSAPGVVAAWHALQSDMNESNKDQALVRLELQWIRESGELDLKWLVHRLMAICLRLLEKLTMPLRRGFGAVCAFLMSLYGDAHWH
jgi:hypothetical protein